MTNPAPASHPPGDDHNEVSQVFEEALEDFKNGLGRKDVERFKQTKRENLIETIEDIQHAQGTKRRLQALVRLKPTLDAVTELGKIIEVFGNSSEYVAFVWGPMKFLLQTASTFADAFTGLLSVYQELGERLPILMSYEDLFKTNPRMGKVMGYLYKDILTFHRKALNYFQQPMWRQLFQAVWNTQKTRFREVIEDIKRHAELVESQAHLSAILSTEQSLEENHEKLDHIIKAQNHRSGRELVSWLRPVMMEDEQTYLEETRREYPGTGAWLLENATFRGWSQPSCQMVPPLLWLNGIPGAGKTVLTSVVVEKLKSLPSNPTVLYFYCKQEDSERNNFASIGRSLLAQLLKANREILTPYFLDKYWESMEAILNSRARIEELLAITIRNCPSVYIVLDGIDECRREERQTITRWFREIVEDVPKDVKPDQVRCLFVSQDDGVARKSFAGITWLKIERDDSKKDIKEFSSKWAYAIQKKFSLLDERRVQVADMVQEAADGMFLLAKLISKHLLDQPSLESLERELKPDRFPNELSKAYTRIIERVFENANETEKTASKMLLSWLVCAKRPLRWYEIQGMKSIDAKSGSVDLHGRKFRVDSKDLCGSLVEIKPDMTVDLIHSTARTFLVESNHVDRANTELELAGLCVDYLNFKGLNMRTMGFANIRELIRGGYYAVMDYAVIYWIRHVEAALVAGTSQADGAARLKFDGLAESLRVFLDLHYKKLGKLLQVPSKTVRILEPLRALGCDGMPNYVELKQAITSFRKQVTFLGDMSLGEICIDLGEVVEKVRGVLEEQVTGPSSAAAERRQTLTTMYGLVFFKCPRLSCKFFTVGFDTKEQRDQHLKKHIRAYSCKVTGCLKEGIGFHSQRELDKHTEGSHKKPELVDDENEFPGEDDLASSGTPGEYSQEPSAVASAGNGASINDSINQSTPPSGSSVPVLNMTDADAPSKKKSKTYTCLDCFKVFNRKFNYTSHRLTHNNGGASRLWKCGECGKSFSRKSDATRHARGHDESEKFTCESCGKLFARRDTLAGHHKSKAGGRCLAPRTETSQTQQAKSSQIESTRIWKQIGPNHLLQI